MPARTLAPPRAGAALLVLLGILALLVPPGSKALSLRRRGGAADHPAGCFPWCSGEFEERSESLWPIICRWAKCSTCVQCQSDGGGSGGGGGGPEVPAATNALPTAQSTLGDAAATATAATAAVAAAASGPCQPSCAQSFTKGAHNSDQQRENVCKLAACSGCDPCVKESPCVDSPCKNGGECHAKEYTDAHNPETYTCECKDGFSGDHCDTKGLCLSWCAEAMKKPHNTAKNICAQAQCTHCDECWMNPCEVHEQPCKNGAACRDEGPNMQPTCTCAAGYRGAFCEELIPPCEFAAGGDPCKNGGTCENGNGLGKYSCICADGFKGTHCEEISYPCEKENVCQNGGTCANKGTDDFDCTCAAGFGGQHCQVQLPCEHKHPCENGGKCANKGGPDNYACTCVAGFEGANCQVNAHCRSTCAASFAAATGGRTVDVCKQGDCSACERCDHIPQCELEPCQHKGECKDILHSAKNDYTCTCTDPFFGKQCELNARCLHWCATAFERNDPQFVCTWSQCKDCDECESIDPCKQRPCQNNGQCTAEVGGRTCTCARGYSGEDCEHTLSPCEEKPCQNDGECKETEANDYECTCAAGFTGKNCETNIGDCKSRPCRNGGVCSDLVDGHACSCAPPFYGQDCEKEHPPGAFVRQDPSTPTAVSHAAKAMALLNAERAKTHAGRASALSVRTIVSYQTQLVDGLQHTFCIESIEDGFLQIVLEETSLEEPFLGSVSPLDKMIKWADGTTKPPAFRCSMYPTPYDPRPKEDQKFGGHEIQQPAILTHRFLETLPPALAEKTTTAAASLLIETSKTNKATTTVLGLDPLPKSWDARNDHARSKVCKKVIEHPQDQGACGSSYAFAATGVASIRACLQGHDVHASGFSVQDVLNCGSIWEGDFANQVIAPATGTRFADNCNGHFELNVFEYATKYGLVDETCQKYDHGGDPLTRMDDNAGSNLCHLKNAGNSPVSPTIKTRQDVSQGYKNFMAALRKAVLLSTAPLSPPQEREFRRIARKANPAWTTRSIGYLLAEFRRQKNRKWAETLLTAPAFRIFDMPLSEPIGPGETVATDTTSWCLNKDYEHIETELPTEPHCIARLTVPHLGDAFSASCRGEKVGDPIVLSGDAGALLAGVQGVCHCSAEQRVYTIKGKVAPHGDQDVTFSELGTHARRECQREKATGEFASRDPLPDKADDKCRKVHKIFHTPVTVSGVTLSEEKLMRAVFDGGAIAIGVRVTDSFLHFTPGDGSKIYDVPVMNEPMVGYHAMLVFGWGEEDNGGKKFWWVKNSWGGGPKRFIKWARGKNLYGIEQLGATWVSVDPPGPARDDSVDLTANPKGFCPDNLLSPNLQADRAKMWHSCVSVVCGNEARKAGGPGLGCTLVFKGCPLEKEKTTVVNLISDANIQSLGFTGSAEVPLKARTACIENIYFENRSETL